MTLNLSERPREEIRSRLSDILEENPDEKYRLSAKACQGILNRAARRGKELPAELKAALTEQSVCKETESTGQIPQDATAPDGAGGGSYTLNTIDRPAVCSAIGFKQGNGAKAGSVGAQEECSPTLQAAESGTNRVPTVMCGNPWDSQSARVYQGDGAWHSLNANESGGQSRDAVLTNMGGVTAVDCRNGTENECVNGTLQAKDQGSSLNLNNVVRTYGR